MCASEMCVLLVIIVANAMAARALDYVNKKIVAYICIRFNE